MALELHKHLGLPKEKFTVCQYGLLSNPSRLPKGERFSPPLHIGHLQRVSHETGTFFILEAWRRAGITSSQAILHLFGQNGSSQLLKNGPYGSLIETGNVRVHEGAIADRMDEVLADLAAVIVAYQWQVGFSAVAYEVIARGVPVIAPEWRDNGGAVCEDGTVDGLNAIKYRNWDVNSLTHVLRKCCVDPSILERLYPTCDLPPAYRQEAFVQRYLEVYRKIVGV